MNIQIKQATLRDLKILLKLEKQASSNTYKAYTTSKEIKSYLQKSNVFLVTDGDMVKGSISYEDKGDGKVYLDGLITQKRYRGKGIAKEAINLLVKKLKTHKFTYVDLLTHPHNTASIVAYLKNGFIINSWVNSPFADGEPRVKLTRKL